MEFLHPKFMFFLIFVMDILYSTSKEAIAVFASGRRAAIATVAVFGALSFSTLILSLIVLVKSEKRILSCCTWFIQVIIVEIYFYGTNMKDIIEKFGEQLGCTDSCKTNNQIAAMGCLGCTVLLLYSIPLLHDYIKKYGSKQHSLWHYFYGVILVLVHINTIYATVLSMIPDDLKCYKQILILCIIFLVVATSIGCISIFSNDEIWEKDELWQTSNSQSYAGNSGGKKHDYLLKGAVCLLIIILPLYLLSNNPLPLHYINCFNSTAVRHDDDDDGDYYDITEHIIKLAGMVLTGVIVVLVMIVFKYKRRTERLAEKGLKLLSGEVNL